MASPPLACCPCCGLVQSVAAPAAAHQCGRCGSRLHRRRDNALSSSLAAASLVLCLPAVTLPFLRIEQLGRAAENSLLGAASALYRGGHLFVAAVVIVFSLVLPPAKLATILLLSSGGHWLSGRHRAAAYRAVEIVGRWGMLDVLLVAVLVAFVKLGDIVAFVPRPGVGVFVLYVLLSLGASFAFDPRALWKEGDMSEIPAAVPAEPRASWRRAAWLALPALALIVALGAVYQSGRRSGRLITVTFADGRGVEPGDTLRHRGIAAGAVERVGLSPAGDAVEIDIRLTPEADALARRGSEFWIVRPQIDLTGIEGLETIVGAKCLAVLPPRQTEPAADRFVGLEDPPLLDLLEAGGLRVVLDARNGTGLRPGLPVLYRGVRVGGVSRRQMATGAGWVELHVYILPQYKHLVCQNTRFWNASGVNVDIGTKGLSIDVASLETMLTGGIAMAVPPDHGPVVADGRRFELHRKPEREWLEWDPLVAPAGAHALPALKRAVCRYPTSRWKFWTSGERPGWLLPMPSGVSAPADVLPPEPPEGTTLVVAGREIPVPKALPLAGGLAYAEMPSWFDARATEQLGGEVFPVDCLLVTDGRQETNLFLRKERFERSNDAWVVNGDLPQAAELHGAAVVAQGSGRVLGQLLVDDGPVRVALLAPRPPQR